MERRIAAEPVEECPPSHKSPGGAKEESRCVRRALGSVAPPGLGEQADESLECRLSTGSARSPAAPFAPPAATRDGPAGAKREPASPGSNRRCHSRRDRPLTIRIDPAVLALDPKAGRVMGMGFGYSSFETLTSWAAEGRSPPNTDRAIDFGVGEARVQAWKRINAAIEQALPTSIHELLHDA